MKRAILCLGAESTGTRVMCRHFNAAGFYGKESGNYFDRGLPVDKDRIVWHRTYPLDGMHTKHRRWVSVGQMVRPLRKAGFTDIRAVVNIRDWYAMIASQVRVGHTDTFRESWERVQQAYPRIFTGLRDNKIPFVIVTYESILLYGKEVLDNMFRMLDIEPPAQIEKIKDGNAKYYSQDSSSLNTDPQSIIKDNQMNTGDIVRINKCDTRPEVVGRIGVIDEIIHLFGTDSLIVEIPNCDPVCIYMDCVTIINSEKS